MGERRQLVARREQRFSRQELPTREPLNASDCEGVSYLTSRGKRLALRHQKLPCWRLPVPWTHRLACENVGNDLQPLPMHSQPHAPRLSAGLFKKFHVCAWNTHAIGMAAQA